MERDGTRVCFSSLRLKKLTGGLATVIWFCDGILSPHLLVNLPHIDPNYRLNRKICRLAFIRRQSQASGCRDPVSAVASIVSRIHSCEMLPSSMFYGSDSRRSVSRQTISCSRSCRDRVHQKSMKLRLDNIT